MIFKIGDKVRLDYIPNKQELKKYGLRLENLKDIQGILTISQEFPKYDQNFQALKFEEDDRKFNWLSKWFEPVTKNRFFTRRKER